MHWMLLFCTFRLLDFQQMLHFFFFFSNFFSRIRKSNVSYRNMSHMPQESEVRELKIYVGKFIINFYYELLCENLQLLNDSLFKRRIRCHIVKFFLGRLAICKSGSKPYGHKPAPQRGGGGGEQKTQKHTKTNSEDILLNRWVCVYVCHLPKYLECWFLSITKFCS